MLFQKRKTLYVLYVEFAKAYDKIPRNALLLAVCRLGCGYMMILAPYHLYSDTKMILGAAVITATVGIKQGSPSSCFYLRCISMN